jgi:hypothetical protein
MLSSPGLDDDLTTTLIAVADLDTGRKSRSVIPMDLSDIETRSYIVALPWYIAGGIMLFIALPVIAGGLYGNLTAQTLLVRIVNWVAIAMATGTVAGSGFLLLRRGDGVNERYRVVHASDTRLPDISEEPLAVRIVYHYTQAGNEENSVTKEDSVE